MRYNPRKIERKWQKIWEDTKIYKTPDKIKGKENFYHLVMFPYPSGDLHIGHWYNFTGADVFARFKRMQGFNVMSPFGFDAFGLPAENAAIKRKIHPKTWTYDNIDRMRKQLKSLGAVYDWSREVITCEQDYYKWTQWMFLQFFKNGLVYKAKTPANFCPSCKTVLANEQVVEGKCERCDSEVLQKEVEQWLFRITDFAEDLLKDLEDLNWPEKTKTMQRNWIGKSEGWEVKFSIFNFQFSIPVFTTRIDTLFGCTYLVLSPEHPFVASLLKVKNPRTRTPHESKPHTGQASSVRGRQISKIKNYESVRKYVEDTKKKTERERISEVREKTGVEVQGIKAINPANGREIPIFVADYVLVHYGTGAIMGVPAHDQRDFDFAKCHNLAIIEVVKGPVAKPSLKEVPLVVSDRTGSGVYEAEGVLINSGRFDGMESILAKKRIGEWLAKKGEAKKAIYYKLKDWLVSRQRYWGVPIPMVFCQDCGWLPVKEKDLPVLLPNIKNFKPTGEGQSPLARSKKFVEAVCLKCGKKAKRETDTMDTFVCSSWYFLRYTDPNNEKKFATREKLKKWLPVNMYIGGAEHTVLHLLYARFFTKVLAKLGYLNFREPFLSLRHQGMILGSNGQKMSKSKGNIVDPDLQVKKYGSDTVRMYLCFMGPYGQGGPWQPKGIVGVLRLLNKVFNLVSNLEKKTQSSKLEDKVLERLLHKTIKKVTEDIENFRFNTAISALMILVNQLAINNQQLTIDVLKTLLLLLAPFSPHLSEELWEKLGGKFSIHNQNWPRYDPDLTKEEAVQFIIQVNGKVRDKIEVKADIVEEKAKELALSQEKIKKWIEGKEIKKVVFVPGKLVNIVV